MTAYEFTRMDAPIDLGAKIKARNIPETSWQGFEKQILAKHPDIRTSSEYVDAHDTFIELTMSCDKEEATMWMKSWIHDSIAYGISTKNLDWQNKFLAAHDIYKSLI